MGLIRIGFKGRMIIVACTSISQLSGRAATPTKVLVRFSKMKHALSQVLKSFRAYNVKPFSTLYSDNILRNLESSLPCARVNCQLGYNLITESWHPSRGVIDALGWWGHYLTHIGANLPIYINLSTADENYAMGLTHQYEESFKI